MHPGRPIVLSLAGLDPSAGAGLLADIKTFEQHKVYGLGIATAITIQTEHEFISNRWEKIEDILKALTSMLSSYTVEAVKIGIVENLQTLKTIVDTIHNHNEKIRIVLDPVISSSTGHQFWKLNGDRNLLTSILRKLTLLTPNTKEVSQLVDSTDILEAAHSLAEFCPVLLKGGHNEDTPGTDYLFTRKETITLHPDLIINSPKHGSGCVLSSSIVSYLALGADLETACLNAKRFTSKYLQSNPSLLGYHAS